MRYTACAYGRSIFHGPEEPLRFQCAKCQTRAAMMWWDRIRGVVVVATPSRQGY